MPIQINWLDASKPVIMVGYQDPWTWSEVTANLNETVAMLDTVTTPVPSIIDFRTVHTTPKLDIRELQKISKHASIKHPNSGIIILVGSRLHIRVMVDVFSRLFPTIFKKYRIVATMAQALEMVSVSAPEEKLVTA